MIVAVVGCLHGKLEFLYEELQAWEKQTGKKVDFIICSGDFQSLRSKNDMKALECPQKYKEMGQFQSYYLRELRAPILTIFIGGNHEASNLLRDLYFGGWVAENIYYLGSSGVVNVKKGEESLRIAGVSGIDKHYDYLKGYFEEWPYVNNHDWLRSIYHIRQFDIQKLKLLTKQVDIFTSHEWPTLATSTARKDQLATLTRIKPHFADQVTKFLTQYKQIQQDRLGSRNLSQLMQDINPRYWFSAHMHVKYNIVIPLKSGATTEFLSLDKPLPKRQYLEVFEIGKDTQKLLSIFKNQQQQTYQQKQPYQKWVPKGSQQPIPDEEEKTEIKTETKVNQSELKFEYDPEWIAILQATDKHIPLYDKRYDFRSMEKSDKELMKEIANSLESLSDQSLSIPFIDSEVYCDSYTRLHPQTNTFIKKFGLDDRLFIRRDNDEEVTDKMQPEIEEVKQSEIGKRTFQEAFREPMKKVEDDNEIDLDL